MPSPMYEEMYASNLNDNFGIVCTSQSALLKALMNHKSLLQLNKLTALGNGEGYFIYMDKLMADSDNVYDTVKLNWMKKLVISNVNLGSLGITVGNGTPAVGPSADGDDRVTFGLAFSSVDGISKALNTYFKSLDISVKYPSLQKDECFYVTFNALCVEEERPFEVVKRESLRALLSETEAEKDYNNTASSNKCDDNIMEVDGFNFLCTQDDMEILDQLLSPDNGKGENKAVNSSSKKTAKVAFDPNNLSYDDTSSSEKENLMRSNSIVQQQQNSRKSTNASSKSKVTSVSHSSSDRFDDILPLKAKDLKLWIIDNVKKYIDDIDAMTKLRGSMAVALFKTGWIRTTAYWSDKWWKHLYVYLAPWRSCIPQSMYAPNVDFFWSWEGLMKYVSVHGVDYNRQAALRNKIKIDDCNFSDGSWNLDRYLKRFLKSQFAEHEGTCEDPLESCQLVDILRSTGWNIFRDSEETIFYVPFWKVDIIVVPSDVDDHMENIDFFYSPNNIVKYLQRNGNRPLVTDNHISPTALYKSTNIPRDEAAVYEVLDGGAKDPFPKIKQFLLNLKWQEAGVSNSSSAKRWIAPWAPRNSDGKVPSASELIRNRDYFESSADVIAYLKLHGVRQVMTPPTTEQPKTKARKVAPIEALSPTPTDEIVAPEAAIRTILADKSGSYRFDRIYHILNSQFDWECSKVIDPFVPSAWVAPWAKLKPESMRGDRYVLANLIKNRDYFVDKESLLTYMEKRGPIQTSAAPTPEETTRRRSKSSADDMPVVEAPRKEEKKLKVVNDVSKNGKHRGSGDKKGESSSSKKCGYSIWDTAQNHIMAILKDDKISYKLDKMKPYLIELGWQYVYTTDPLIESVWVGPWVTVRNYKPASNKWNIRLFTAGLDYFADNKELLAHVYKNGPLNAPGKIRNEVATIVDTAEGHIATIVNDDKISYKLDKMKPYLIELGWTYYFYTTNPLIESVWVAPWLKDVDGVRVGDHKCNLSGYVESADYFVDKDEFLNHLQRYGPVRQPADKPTLEEPKRRARVSDAADLGRSFEESDTQPEPEEIIINYYDTIETKIQKTLQNHLSGYSSMNPWPEVKEYLKQLGWQNVNCTGDFSMTYIWLSPWGQEKTSNVGKGGKVNVSNLIRNRDYFVESEDVMKYLIKHGALECLDPLTPHPTGLARYSRRSLNGDDEKGPKKVPTVSAPNTSQPSDSAAAGAYSIAYKSPKHLVSMSAGRSNDDIRNDLFRLTSLDGTPMLDAGPGKKRKAVGTFVKEHSDIIEKLQPTCRTMLVAMAIHEKKNGVSTFTDSDMFRVYNEYAKDHLLSETSADTVVWVRDDLVDYELLTPTNNNSFEFGVHMASILQSRGVERIHLEALSEYFFSHTQLSQ